MASVKTESPSRRERVERGIYKRIDSDGKDRFEIGFRDAQRRQRWQRVDGGIMAARAALADAHAARGRREKVGDPHLRFDDAVEAWWNARVVRLRPATQSAYGAALKHLRPRFGGRRLSDITPSDVAAFITSRQSEGAKGWTIKGELTVLSGIYQHASRHLRFVGGSPVAVLDRVERPSTEDQKPKRVLGSHELDRLLASVDEYHRLIFEFAAETGARLSEVLGIVWGEVDFDSGSVRFTHQLDRQGHRAPLKTRRSQRTIEITPHLTSKLRAARLAAAKSTDHDFVFVSRAGTPHDHRNIGGRVLARAIEKAGLGATERDGQILVPSPTFHNLRHSHGSALIASGWDIEEVSARLGHANVSTTARIYVHEYDVARRSQSRRDRLAAMYSEPSTTSSSPDFGL
jgi:integrase